MLGVFKVVAVALFVSIGVSASAATEYTIFAAREVCINGKLFNYRSQCVKTPMTWRRQLDEKKIAKLLAYWKSTMASETGHFFVEDVDYDEYECKNLEKSVREYVGPGQTYTLVKSGGIQTYVTSTNDNCAGRE